MNCPWCSKEISDQFDTFHMSGECVGNRYDQTPHPFSREWCDPLWRNKWLNGMDDEQIESYTHEQLKVILPAFEKAGHHLVFGQYAVALREIVESITLYRMVQVMTYKQFSIYKRGLDLLKNRGK